MFGGHYFGRPYFGQAFGTISNVVEHISLWWKNPRVGTWLKQVTSSGIWIKDTENSTSWTKDIDT